MSAKHTPGPFSHVAEEFRPRDTGRFARFGAPIYHNPGCNPPQDCALDRKTGLLYSLQAWDMVCNERVRDAAPELLEALEGLLAMDSDALTDAARIERKKQARAALAKAKGES